MLNNFTHSIMFHHFHNETHKPAQGSLSKGDFRKIIHWLGEKYVLLGAKTYMKKFFNGRDILIAREVTKLHETFYRGNIDTIKMFKTKIKGELTVVLSEKNIKNKILDESEIKKKAKIYLKKYSLKDVVELLFKSEKIHKKKIYQICLEIKNNEKNN